jgi:hypothetical protein
MLDIKIGETVLNIPEGWQEVTLEVFEWLSRTKPKTTEEQIKYVCKAAGVDYNWLRKQDLGFVVILVDKMGWVFKDADYLPSNSFVQDGVTWECLGENELTLGEYLDTEKIVTSGEEDTVAKCLAVVCRPVGEPYNPDLVPSRIEFFKGLTLDKVLPVLGFFLQLNQLSETILNNYTLIMNLIDLNVQNLKNSQGSGGSIL